MQNPLGKLLLLAVVLFGSFVCLKADEKAEQDSTLCQITTLLNLADQTADQDPGLASKNYRRAMHLCSTLSNSTLRTPLMLHSLEGYNNVKYSSNQPASTFVYILASIALIMFIGNLWLVYRLHSIHKKCTQARKDTLLTNNQVTNLEQELIELQQNLAELAVSNSQLSEENTSKDRFLSIIAHDLRNPLNIVTLTAEFLDESYDSFARDEIHTYIKELHSSSLRLKDLLDNLLDWSRNQSRTMKYQPQTIDLGEIAAELVELYTPNAGQKQIELKDDIAPQTYAFADRNMITTVLRNLLNNAIKFTQEQGQITISAKVANDIIEVMVADTGVGIPQQNLKKLFKVDSNPTTRGTEDEAGTGLGLVLCKEFIDKHDGQIWVESEVGKGSVFHFTLASDFTFEDFAATLTNN